MKLKLLALSTAILLSACSSTKVAEKDTVSSGPITAINAQKLNTSFKQKGIKLEWDCSWYEFKSTCEKGSIRAIEVSAYAPSFGNSEVNRDNAFMVAETKAKAKLRHFIHEDIHSSQVTNTLVKNVEKANDKIKSRISNTEEVSMSDTDASTDTNYAVRENTNEVVRTVTENITSQAGGILRGVYIADSRIVDRQTVEVTIRWDAGSDRASNILKKKFR